MHCLHILVFVQFSKSKFLNAFIFSNIFLFSDRLILDFFFFFWYLFSSIYLIIILSFLLDLFFCSCLVVFRILGYEFSSDL